MALIKCPECGTEVSDRALQCIKCGCPLNNVLSNALISFEQTYVIRYKCTVICNGIEYSCKQGESVEVPVSQPTEVQIKISGGNGKTSTVISPGRKYYVTNGGGVLGTKPVVSAY